MKFSPPLIQGHLIKRYKRFLADVMTPEGETITIHCPNTGSMRACLAPGSACWYSLSESKTRKYPHTWEIATTPDGHLAGINTHRANALVEELIRSGQVPAFAGYRELKREVKYGEGSRIDLLLSGEDLPDCYVEVKNVTLHEGDGKGYFPDAVSSRGAKHLQELMAMVAAGHRAVLFFCVQHSGISQVAAARHIDPTYADLLTQAQAAGVEVMAWRARMSAASVELTEVLPVVAS
ncbi:DNA/RNA nuclease SfsA [Simiduia agarivorans]|uniref:Sugar fermentation stimulation protein homolog n=1 Tax=Simiduia agarivorans (strain DSM 21679 / JCM 13881 / BCRC 17597 / SA1) TaxID=1117647 RepID=K4KXM0_SIMAS|nr:DNA/RNA nuclease SfsA [Simiduia agarivorans]AFU98647.1 DNA-binding transcriptional regulator [Simiduia agarivorans SA1 = DSM 21679]